MKSGDITGVTGVPELTWCYNRNTHQPYDLKIKLEDGVTPPFGPIYSLSPHELQTLREFIDEHLANCLIHLTRSLSGALVLFIKKKDGSLRLSVDF